NDQDSMADRREIMLDPKILKRTFLGYDLFEKFPQLRNVPLTTTEFVNTDPLGFLPGNPECIIKSLVARDNPKTPIEHQQRFSNGFDNAFSICSGILGKLLNVFYFCNIYNVNYNPIDYIIDCAVREHADQKPVAAITPNLTAFPVQGVQYLRGCLAEVKSGNFRCDVADRSSD